MTNMATMAATSREMPKSAIVMCRMFQQQRPAVNEGGDKELRPRPAPTPSPRIVEEPHLELRPAEKRHRSIRPLAHLKPVEQPGVDAHAFGERGADVFRQLAAFA